MDRRQFIAATTLTGALATGNQAGSQTQTKKASAQPYRAYLDTRLGQIHYWTAGKGPTLLLIHQSGNSGAEFLNLVPLLSKDFRLVAVDLPGHGNSDDPPQEPTVEDYAFAARSVLDHLAEDVAYVLGHHGGALVAMKLAGDEPHRFKKTILSGTSGLRSREESEAFIERLKKTKTTLTKDPSLVAETWQNYVGMMSPGGSIQDIYKPFLQFLAARQRPYRAIFVYLAWDRRPSLEKLQGPVLLLQGETDEFVSRQETLLEQLPQARREVLENCGTFMFYDKAPDCARVIKDYLT